MDMYLYVIDYHQLIKLNAMYIQMSKHKNQLVLLNI